MLFTLSKSFGQDENWTLNDCINYALEHNIQVKKAQLSSQSYSVKADQAKANRLPSASASVRQSFSFDKNQDTQTGEYGSLAGSNSSNYSLNSSVTLFNGFKLQNELKQSNINLEASQYYTETVKESVELNILNAFLQVIYAQEQVKNAEDQLNATTEELRYAKERFELSAISKSDYLQIESQLASEKLTLATAQNQLSISKVNLMQLMELPLSDNFKVISPDIDAQLQRNQDLSVSEIYTAALRIKPQIKNAFLATESARIDTDIAKADLFPSLSMDASIGTDYTSLTEGTSYANQLNNNISPGFGFTFSIPIFQKKQVKNNIALAKISASDAQLDETDTRNQLRKEIEQAYTDVLAARSEFLASKEKLQAAEESFLLAEEKYNLGALNSVDFLFEKTNLITAESELLQSKFNLVFSNKIIDYYKGTPLTL